MMDKRGGYKKLLLGSFLFVLSCFGIQPAAPDFDFYTTDLISKESYRKISLDFRDASLKTILKIFSEQSGLNFIASQSIQDRTITLYLDNVPLKEALDNIMAANNLKYELDPGSNIFIVRETGRPDIETITKIYHLKYARLKTSRLESAIAGGAAGGASGGAAAGGPADSGGGASSGEGGGGGGGIEDVIMSVLSPNGKIKDDPRTNTLVIQDIPVQFELIDKVIALLDVPSPQVMIEVEMLDVSKKTIDEMGVDTTASIMQLKGSSTETKFPFSIDGRAGIPSPAFTYGTLSNAVFTAVLDLLTTDTRTKFLARPRILTMNNESAEIKIATNEAIGQNTVTTSSEGTATSTQAAERVETGVSLKVTPQIDSHSGYVTMFIQPVVSEAKTGATFGSTTFKDPEVRSSTTTLMVRDGETIVVGGLIRTKDETTIKKIPFLGDIPLAGGFFRHKDKTQEERELIVFITPRIIGNSEAVALARSEGIVPIKMPVREQGTALVRKEEIDNMLKRWEN